MTRIKEFIKDRIFERYELPHLKESIKRIKKAGFRPALWVDVGAHCGDVAALFRQTWPEARGVCLEGQESPLKQLKGRFQNDRQVTILGKLAGARSKKGVVLHGQETSASVLEEHVKPQAQKQEVEMTTLDQEIPLSPSTPGEKLIKIDTQGYELEILKGAEGVLQNTGVLILELNLIEIHKGVPLADEVIAWLKSRGFQIYDIAGLTRRPRDRALWQADFVFVPVHSPLRANKSYV